jgi:phospholipase/carboxylesterase
MKSKKLFTLATIVALLVIGGVIGFIAFPAQQSQSQQQTSQIGLQIDKSSIYGEIISHPEAEVTKALWWNGTDVAPNEASFDASKPLYLLMHGYSSDETEWPALLKQLLPDNEAANFGEPNGAQYVSIQAPIALGKNYFSDGGYAWFEPALPDDASLGAAQSAAAILAWIKQNIPNNQPIIPMGFSQGAVMAVELVRQDPSRFEAAISMSGWVNPAILDGDANSDLKEVSVFFAYGLDDEVVPLDRMQQGASWLESNVKATVKVYPEMRHAISSTEIADIKNFLELEQIGNR